jgi:hypothetical protein
VEVGQAVIESHSRLLVIQLNDAKNSSKSLAAVISLTRREFPELKPEFLDGAQPGFNGLPSPVLFVCQ